MTSGSNELRIPFAEWLYRMSEGEVPYQARALAVYAVAFKITSNEELACLVGMDTKGVADKTYNKWKRWLSDHGWVIVKQVTVGRTTTIEVAPAFHETPVTFTDMKAREPRKFAGSSSVPITDAVAVEGTAEPEKVTDETRNNYGPAVEVTDASCAPAPARIEPPSGVNISNKKPTTTTVYSNAEVGGGGADLDDLNGSATDLLAFISKHAHVDAAVAQRMLTNNIKAFSADAMMEAYSVTTAEMASGIVAAPYKYLIGVARTAKERGQRAKGRSGTPEDSAAKKAWERDVIEQALKGVSK